MEKINLYLYTLEPYPDNDVEINAIVAAESEDEADELIEKKYPSDKFQLSDFEELDATFYGGFRGIIFNRAYENTL